MKRRTVGFTLIELLVVISIIALLIGILLPALGAARKAARKTANSTQLRGCHQGLVIHAQDNKGYFPGLTSKGVLGNAGDLGVGPSTDIYSVNNPFVGGATTRARSAILLNTNIVTPEYLINPGDTDLVPATKDSPVNAFPNLSYAMLMLRDDTAVGGNINGQPPFGSRGQDWKDSMNGSAIVMSDRNTGNDADAQVSSVWTEQDGGKWEGTVVRNDNSTSFENSHLIDASRYGSGPTIEGDNLFDVGTGTAGSSFYNANAAMVMRNLCDINAMANQ
ncbi:prepilin-type N-terminal cleavage/methylation domain-containing protein [Phycisphaeraceae bacterium D3-23]